MSKSRGSDMSQKQSSPSRCDSDPLHRRPVTHERKSIQTNSGNQKKLVGRITNLESQLGQAQEELKIMKSRLNSSETVKRVMKSKKSSLNSSKGSLRESRKHDETVLSEIIGNETDVFEVPIESKHERSEEINVLKAMLEGKEKELEISVEENEKLKIEVALASADQAKEEEMRSRVRQLVEEVEESKEKRKELVLKLEGMEAEKEEMESEMRKLRIQTEQWRKAADAAAALVLSEAGKERRISERWGNSMDKQYGNIFENPVGGYNADDQLEDDLVGRHGKRKGSGIRMLGELWKKKGQK